MQVLFLGIDDSRAESHGMAGDTLLDDLVQTNERTAADEENVAGIDLQHLLVRMLSSPLGRYGCIGSFDDFQKSLLNTLTTDIACDRRVLTLLGNLVDLIDEDDSVLSRLDVVVGVLDEFEQDVLNVFTDIASLGKGGCISDGEGDLQLLGKGGGKQGLAGTGGTYHQDVGLIQLHSLFSDLLLELDPLVVVVYGNCEHALCVVLADDILIHVLLQFLRSGDTVGKSHRVLLERRITCKHIVAYLDALIANGNTRAVDEPFYFFLAFAAERTDFRVSCHQLLLLMTLSTIP